MPNSLENLDRIYRRRFDQAHDYRNRVWRVLTRHYFGRFVAAEADVLDLGCGYGEFINNIQCGRKIAMDANPDTAEFLDSGIEYLCQDCSQTWDLPEASLDVVFTSNFFEHLPDKAALERTLGQAHRCLRGGGRLVALGPNIKFLGGRYWDFWDHFLPLTELSLAEAMEISGLSVSESVARFLPFTMSDGRRYPDLFIRLYLGLPMLWKAFGHQFLLVAEKEPA